VAWSLGRVFPPDNRVLRHLSDGKLWLYLNDGYWVRLILRDWQYEPEVGAVLRRFLAPGSYFIDGGANIGYWSLVASKSLLADSVVAVEASPSTYHRLRENADLNGNRWQCIHAALWDSEGDTITVHSAVNRHESGTVVQRLAPPESSASEVATTTLDAVVERYAGDGDRPIVIKLDVEGAEIAALRGAARTIANRDVILIYEDHGQDRAHTVTRVLLNELGLQVYAIHSSGALKRVHAVSDLDAIKVGRWKGYNFLATHRPLQV
jgi:FkbM family methyltransferase